MELYMVGYKTGVAADWVVLGGFVVAITWALLRARRPRRSSLVYRRVVEQTDALLTLECGHTYSIVRHKRESIPCEACAAEGKEQEEEKR